MAQDDADVPFDTFQGEIVVIENPSQWTAELDDWMNEQEFLGFDSEWKPDHSKHQSNPISLLQLSSLDRCILIRTKPNQPLPPSVADFLQNPETTKVCAGYDGSDVHKMQQTFGYGVENTIGLDKIASDRGFRRPGIKGIAEAMGLKIRKDKKICRSNWACYKLSQEQIQYAAEDAYYSLALYYKIKDLPTAHLCPVTECWGFFEYTEDDGPLREMPEFISHVENDHGDELQACGPTAEFEKKLYYLAKKIECCHHCLAAGKFADIHPNCPSPSERPCWKCANSTGEIQYHGQCGKIPLKNSAPAPPAKRARVEQKGSAVPAAKPVAGGQNAWSGTGGWYEGQFAQPGRKRPLPSDEGPAYQMRRIPKR